MVSQFGRDYSNILLAEISISLESITEHWVGGV